MVVESQPAGAGVTPRVKGRLLWWSVMAAATFWTLVYRYGFDDANLPEFVYVNF